MIMMMTAILYTSGRFLVVLYCGWFVQHSVQVHTVLVLLDVPHIKPMCSYQRHIVTNLPPPLPSRSSCTALCAINVHLCLSIHLLVLFFFDPLYLQWLKQPDNFGNIFQVEVQVGKYFQKNKHRMIFDGVMIMGTLPTSLLQMFCLIILNSEAIVRMYYRSRGQFQEEALSINGPIAITGQEKHG